MRGARRFLAIMRRDATLAWRNGQIVVAAAVMAIMILLVLFLPAEVTGRATTLLLDESADGWLAAVAGSAVEGGSWAFAKDRASFEAALLERKASLGIEASGGLAAPAARIRAGASVPEENLALARATLGALVRRARGEAVAPGLVLRSGGARWREPPLNLKGVPIFIVFEVGILGFLLVAVFLFQEKAEGSLMAYRASPGGAAAYVSAKVALFAVISLGYGGGVVAAAVAKGARPDYPLLVSIIILSSATMTFLGLGFATYFQNLSQWFFPGIAVLVLNLMPAIAYAVPAFDPAWIRFLPSYDAIFLTKDALLGPGSGIEAAAILRPMAWFAVSAAFAYWSVGTRLLKGGR